MAFPPEKIEQKKKRAPVLGDGSCRSRVEWAFFFCRRSATEREVYYTGFFQRVADAAPRRRTDQRRHTSSKTSSSMAGSGCCPLTVVLSSRSPRTVSEDGRVRVCAWCNSRSCLTLKVRLFASKALPYLSAESNGHPAASTSQGRSAGGSVATQRKAGPGF